jgi:SAM-dependent methyltransferase
MALLQTAERIAEEHLANNVIYQRHLIAYLEAEKRISGKVLEVGSGEGYGLKILCKRATDYFAVDKFPCPAVGTPGTENVHFKQASIPPLPYRDNEFDFVVSFQVIEHIEDDVMFVKEIARVLKPGGTLILTTPNRTMSLTRNPFHTREYTGPELGSLIGKFLPEISVMGVFGNDKVLKYYEANRQSVERITRFDILDLQHRLPRWMLQIPYDMANWINRKRLLKENAGLVSGIKAEDHFVDTYTDRAFDLFVVAKK